VLFIFNSNNISFIIITITVVVIIIHITAVFQMHYCTCNFEDKMLVLIVHIAIMSGC